MSGDTNGNGRAREHPGEPAHTPWTIRPGTPLDDSGEPQQDPYGATESGGTTATGGPRRGRAATRKARGRRKGATRASSGSSASPDWGVLADRESRRRARARTNRLRIAAALVAVAVIGAAAAWLTSSGDDSDTSASAGPGGAATAPGDGKPTFKPAPTVPPPPDSATVLADPGLDTAPFTADALFPTARLAVDGRVYNVVAKQLDNTCADAANPALGTILRAKACVQIIRATAVGPDGTAATIAVAAFTSPADAKAAAVEGNTNGEASLLALLAAPVTELCPQPLPDKPGVVCVRQTNSVGRYGLFLVGGYPGPGSRIDPAKGDPKVEQAGDDLDRAIRDALTRRGEERSQAIYEQAKAEAEKALQGH